MNNEMLKKRISLEYGYAVRASKEAKGDYPVFGSNGPIGFINSYKVKGPGIVVGRKGSVGKVTYSDISFTPTDTAYYVKILDSRKDDLRFWSYFLPLLGLDKLNSHSAVPGLSRELAYLIEPSIPDLDVQLSIAKLLNLIDEKIELNNRINAELEAMAKTLYDYWFVQFDFPDANGKPYKTSGGKMVYNETLKREIPEGWSSKALGHLIAKAPTVPKLKRADYGAHGKIPIIDQSVDLICGFTNEDKFTISPIKAHVVFGDHTRIVKLVNFDYARGADGTQILISRSNNVSDYLLYQIVNSIDLSNYGYARHFKFLKSTEVVEPDWNTSVKYEQVVEPIFEKIKTGIFENIELKKLRDWLLPMLMNGQVTVK